MIPLLTRIEQELAQCSDPLRAAELQAERASYLARIGDFAAANQILAALRRSFGDGRDVRVSVWIMLAEGLVLYFEKLSSSARDRIFRANAICRAMNVMDLRCLTGAWLAHLDFERSAYEDMGQSLVDSLSCAAPDAFSTHTRVGMVLGDAHLYSGDRLKAQYWYEICRQNAVQAGDQASIGALMYNRSVFGLARLRVDFYALGLDFDVQSLDFVDLEMASAWNFQLGTRVESLSHLTLLGKARIAMLRCRFNDAIVILKPLLTSLNMIEDRPNRSSVLADLIACHSAVEQHDDVLQLMSLIDVRGMKSLDIDDQFVGYSQILKASRFSTAPDWWNEVQLACLQSRSDFEQEQSRLHLILSHQKMSI